MSTFFCNQWDDIKLVLSHMATCGIQEGSCSPGSANICRALGFDSPFGGPAFCNSVVDRVDEFVDALMTLNHASDRYATTGRRAVKVIGTEKVNPQHLELLRSCPMITPNIRALLKALRAVQYNCSSELAARRPLLKEALDRLEAVIEALAEIIITEHREWNWASWGGLLR